MNRKRGDAGFTLVELVMIIVILGVLAVTAYVKWPTGMREAAAVRELKRAMRYAQHHAMTREYTTAAAAWGLTIESNRYTVQRADGSVKATVDYQERYLLGDSSITLSGPPSIRFNGLGEPIDAAGAPLQTVTSFFVVADGTGTTVSLTPVTGYVQ